MIPFQAKSFLLPGTNYKEIYKSVIKIYSGIEKRTKRKPYLRSAYFHKQKIFFDYFWPHLLQKPFPERVRRLKFFLAAIELIKENRNHPLTVQNPSKKTEVLHRFAGISKDKKFFFVQIKENKRTGRKQLMSIFPTK